MPEALVVAVGGIAFALAINVGGWLSLRSRITREELSVQCDLRIRYRGASATVLLTGGVLGFALLAYFMVVRLSH